MVLLVVGQSKLKDAAQGQGRGSPIDSGCGSWRLLDGLADECDVPDRRNTHMDHCPNLPNTLLALVSLNAEGIRPLYLDPSDRSRQEVRFKETRLLLRATQE